MSRRGEKHNTVLPVDSATFLTQTPFRVMERIFKRKAPLPEAIKDAIIDPRSCHADSPDYSIIQLPDPKRFCRLLQDPKINSNDVPSLDDESAAKITALTFKAYPGLVVIPQAVSPAAERTIIKQCMRDWTCRPNVTNLDTHYVIGGGARGLWGIFEDDWQAGNQNKNNNEPDTLLPRRTTPVANSMEAYAQDEAAAEAKAATTAAEKPLPNTLMAPSCSTCSSTTLIPPTDGELIKVGTVDEPLNIDPPTTSTHHMIPLKASKAVRDWRWSSLGLQYNWGTKEYHTDRHVEVPEPIRDMCHAIVKSVEEVTQYSASRYKSEAGIINFYQLEDSLTAHQDRSEVDDSAPLVSFSFGHSCIFLMGQQTREEAAPTAIELRSGDVVVMSGPCRRNFHGVPRILKGTLPDYLQADAPDSTERDDDWDVFADFLSTTRINLNIRQVYPPNQ